MPPSTVDPFPADALEANRSGSLSDEQRRHLRNYVTADRWNRVLVGLFFVFVGIVLTRTAGRGPNGWMLPWVGAAILVGGAAYVLHSLGFGDRLLADVREARVQQIEGAIVKLRTNTAVSNTRSAPRFVRVEGKRFHVSPAGYTTAPDGGIVRLYYLPRSRRVVNLERLPDRPLPPGMMESPVEVIRTLGKALRSRDPIEQAEANATLAALKSAIRGPAAPPPPEQRDPRPLAQAIVGRWRVGPLSLEFSRDGSVTLQPAGGESRTGRWWVDPEGHLHSDAQGEEQSGEAWIAGDALTLSIGGERITLHRA